MNGRTSAHKRIEEELEHIMEVVGCPVSRIHTAQQSLRTPPDINLFRGASFSLSHLFNLLQCIGMLNTLIEISASRAVVAIVGFCR